MPEPVNHLKTGAPYGSIVQGQKCWFKEKDGAWVEVEVHSIDSTMQPPVYSVAVQGRGVRETERENLSVLRPPPEGQAPAEWAINPPTDRPKIEETEEDWTVYQDTDGAEYYHNAKTGQTTWDVPQPIQKRRDMEAAERAMRQAAAPPAPPKPIPPPPSLPPPSSLPTPQEEKPELPQGVSAVIKIEGTEWSEARLSDGSGVYFFNSSSGETTWEVPPGRPYAFTAQLPLAHDVLSCPSTGTLEVPPGFCMLARHGLYFRFITSQIPALVL